MEIFKEVAADNPILSRVSADSIKVADARAMIAWRVPRVLEPAVFHHTVVDADPVRDVSGIGLYELRAGIKQLDTI